MRALFPGIQGGEQLLEHRPPPGDRRHLRDQTTSSSERPRAFTAFIAQRKFAIEVPQREGDEPRVVSRCRYLRRSVVGFHPEHKNFRQHCGAPQPRTYPIGCHTLASADVMAITKWSIG